MRLKKMQSMDKRDLEQIQAEKLRRIVTHAYSNVPYYQNLFHSAKIKPDDINSVEDLKKIPITSKKDIQENYHQMIANGVNLAQCYVMTTTGSTGRPLKIFFSEAEQDYSSALLRFVPKECDLRFEESFVDICALSRPYVKPYFYPRLFMKIGQVSLYNSIARIAEILKKIKPDAICTYPSALTILAKYLIEEQDFEIRPKLIFTLGETLTSTHREIVRKVFDININDIYGCEEFGHMAFECNEHSGLHMITDSCVFEFLNGGAAVSSGEKGEIVITGLYNYTMPLIRYRIGDIGIPTDERCSCGRNFPLLKQVTGRNDDFLVLPSGTIISPRNINVLEGIPGILQYQTIQEKRDKFFVKVVKGKEFTENTIEQIRNIIEAGCLGEDVSVQVEIVDEIPKERTGKIRTIISKTS